MIAKAPGERRTSAHQRRRCLGIARARVDRSRPPGGSLASNALPLSAVQTPALHARHASTSRGNMTIAEQFEVQHHPARAARRSCHADLPLGHVARDVPHRRRHRLDHGGAHGAPQRLPARARGHDDAVHGAPGRQRRGTTAVPGDVREARPRGLRRGRSRTCGIDTANTPIVTPRWPRSHGQHAVGRRRPATASGASSIRCRSCAGRSRPRPTSRRTRLQYATAPRPARLLDYDDGAIDPTKYDLMRSYVDATGHRRPGDERGRGGVRGGPRARLLGRHDDLGDQLPEHRDVRVRRHADNDALGAGRARHGRRRRTGPAAHPLGARARS